MPLRPVKPRDLRKFTFISDPQMSPDGSKVAYVHTTIDYDKNDYVKHIWLHDVSSGRDTQFTSGIGKDSYPRWSPSGNKLLFLSSGREPDSKTELYIINVSGGEAQKVASLETGVSNPVWSPDGKTVLFSSRVWEPEKPDTDVVVVTRIWYKLNGVGMFAGKRVHLFAVKATGGKPKQLTKGEFDVGAYTWSPDSKEIAYVTNKTPDQDRSHIRDIYVIPAKGGEANKITKSIHEIDAISWSTHGIAYFGSDFHANGATNADIWVMQPGGEPVNITYLAEHLIRLAGKEPGRDIEIIYTGLRPGEKLFEQLFHELEPYEQTSHEKILLAHPREADWDELRAELRGSEMAVRRYDTKYLQQALARLVPELAKSGFNTEPAKVIPIYKNR